MKYLWLTLFLLCGCAKHIPPAKTVSHVVVPQIKIIPYAPPPPEQKCISFTQISDESLKKGAFEDYIKKHRVEDAIKLATLAWNMATYDHYQWHGVGECDNTIYVIIVQTDKEWGKISKVHAVEKNDVGFALVDKQLIFIRPDVSAEKYGFRGFVLVLTHELGHIIGMPHVDDDLDIMNPSFFMDTIGTDVCLGGCIKIGPQTIKNIKLNLDINGKEVIIL